MLRPHTLIEERGLFPALAPDFPDQIGPSPCSTSTSSRNRMAFSPQPSPPSAPPTGNR
jgi:hypothetical protein